MVSCLPYGKPNDSLYADTVCSVYSVMDVKWTAVQVYKRNNIKREITQRARPLVHTPYWVATLIQQQTDQEIDHLSPLWSPYKSSTFPLLSSTAHKLIKLAFPCCFWQNDWERRPARCIVGGRRVHEPIHTDPHTYRMLFCFDGLNHKTAILTRMIHVQLLRTAE